MARAVAPPVRDEVVVVAAAVVAAVFELVVVIPLAVVDAAEEDAEEETETPVDAFFEPQTTERQAICPSESSGWFLTQLVIHWSQM